jgi:ribosomal subunit interface protein
MDRPLELIFHNMKPSTELKKLIHERTERLEQLHQHIVGCRVTVDHQNRTHSSGNIPEVNIEIQVPGQSLTVDHKHIHGGDALTAIHDAFDAMAVQIKKYKARKTGDVKQHKVPEDTTTE